MRANINKLRMCFVLERAVKDHKELDVSKTIKECGIANDFYELAVKGQSGKAPAFNNNINPFALLFDNMQLLMSAFSFNPLLKIAAEVDKRRLTIGGVLVGFYNRKKDLSSEQFEQLLANSADLYKFYKSAEEMQVSYLKAKLIKFMEVRGQTEDIKFFQECNVSELSKLFGPEMAERLAPLYRQCFDTIKSFSKYSASEGCKEGELEQLRLVVRTLIILLRNELNAMIDFDERIKSQQKKEARSKGQRPAEQLGYMHKKNSKGQTRIELYTQDIQLFTKDMGMSDSLLKAGEFAKLLATSEYSKEVAQKFYADLSLEEEKKKNARASFLKKVTKKKPSVKETETKDTRSKADYASSENSDAVLKKDEKPYEALLQELDFACKEGNEKKGEFLLAKLKSLFNSVEQGLLSDAFESALVMAEAHSCLADMLHAQLMLPKYNLMKYDERQIMVPSSINQSEVAQRNKIMSRYSELVEAMNANVETIRNITQIMGEAVYKGYEVCLIQYENTQNLYLKAASHYDEQNRLRQEDRKRWEEAKKEGKIPFKKAGAGDNAISKASKELLNLGDIKQCNEICIKLVDTDKNPVTKMRMEVVFSESSVSTTEENEELSVCGSIKSQEDIPAFEYSAIESIEAPARLETVAFALEGTEVKNMDVLVGESRKSYSFSL